MAMVRSLLSVRRLPQLAAAGALCSALLAAAPVPASAGPVTDAQGFVDSTARCGTVDATVLYGSTDASRVAICKTGNTFEYRGVRVRDGAKLVAPATPSGDGFRVESSGFTYLVTAKSLVVSQGSTTIREETMVDFHRPGASAPQGTAQGTPAPQNAPTAQNVPQPLESATPSTPLPPPLPAEVGAKR
jgi:hypothetical protein